MISSEMKVEVDKILGKLGYTESHFTQIPLGSPNPVFQREFYIGPTIYGRSYEIHYVLYHPLKWPDGLGLDCRSQKPRGGSADVKFPYFVLSVAKNQNNLETVFVLGKKGPKNDVMNWMRQQVNPNKNLLAVVRVDKLERLLINGRGKLPKPSPTVMGFINRILRTPIRLLRKITSAIF